MKKYEKKRLSLDFVMTSRGHDQIIKLTRLISWLNSALITRKKPNQREKLIKSRL